MIMMEVLSELLNRTPNGFQFLHRYEKIRLTHLDFVDDLMIFCRANRCSLQFVKDVLEYYEGLSGLKANIGKSSMFVAGVGQGGCYGVVSVYGLFSRDPFCSLPWSSSSVE